MKYISAILFTFFCFAQTAFSQISEQGQPISFKDVFFQNDVPVLKMQPIDVNNLLNEDALDVIAGDMPYRFGKDMAVDFHLENSGVWQPLENGDRVWLLTIFSEGAFSLNFIMNRFYLPEGARLFVYNEQNRRHLGAFTEANNNADSVFATAPLAGDKVTFELFEPSEQRGKSIMHISYVIHAYRNLFGTAKDYGQSGACNINVNCPEGMSWQNEKRAVAMILSANNNRICSGALVNNVRQDGTPYFLTANHCLMGSNTSTWIFMFNYESPSCVNQNGPVNQTVQGSIQRAKASASDFALLELTTPPPPHYNVYYAGWSALDVPADSCVGIHHPQGDIKKITFDYDTVASSGYSGAGNDHWRISEWELGTTEGGSSGSPLFDKHRRIIGQLHGGSASCNNPGGYDAYGKFSYSWATGSSPASRLKDWLDPDDTGTMVIDGQDFNTPQFAIDAALANIISPDGNTLCQLVVNPQVLIRNNGSQPLTSLDVNYALNLGGYQTQQWTGNLSFLQAANLSLPAIYLSPGQQILHVYISNPNGVSDENNSNDTLSVNFEAIIGNEVVLTIKTDNYPEETSWKLLDSLGNLLYSNGSLTAQTLHTDFFCLHNGCYKFVILDTYGDGLAGGGWWNPSPPGTYTVSFLGATLGSGSGNFGYSDTIHFCVNQSNVKTIMHDRHVEVYPNPAGDLVFIDMGSNPEFLYFEVFDLNGKKLYESAFVETKHSINTSSWANGIYLLKLAGNQNYAFKRIVIAR